MTIGPKAQTYPIIFHYDDNGNPRRLAETNSLSLSSLSISSITVESISAGTYLNAPELTGVSAFGNLADVDPNITNNLGSLLYIGPGSSVSATPSSNFATTSTTDSLQSQITTLNGTVAGLPTTFSALTDVGSYASQGDKIVRVNSAGSGITFVNLADITDPLYVALNPTGVQEISNDLTIIGALSADYVNGIDFNVPLGGGAGSKGIVQLNNNITHFLRGDGSWATTSGAGGSGIANFYQLGDVPSSIYNSTNNNKILYVDYTTSNILVASSSPSVSALTTLSTNYYNTSSNLNTLSSTYLAHAASSTVHFTAASLASQYLSLGGGSVTGNTTFSRRLTAAGVVFDATATPKSITNSTDEITINIPNGNATLSSLNVGPVTATQYNGMQVVTTSKVGGVPLLPGNTYEYLNGNGAWVNPVATGATSGLLQYSNSSNKLSASNNLKYTESTNTLSVNTISATTYSNLPSSSSVSSFSVVNTYWDTPTATQQKIVFVTPSGATFRLEDVKTSLSAASVVNASIKIYTGTKLSNLAELQTLTLKDNNIPETNIINKTLSTNEIVQIYCNSLSDPVGFIDFTFRIRVTY